MNVVTVFRRVYDRVSGADARVLAKARALAANDRQVLTARVSELMGQVRTLARRGELDGSAPPPSAPAAASLARSRQRAKFTVFSNPRSGSTWLETMLGLLPDVHVDYELKWGATYTLGGIGLALDEDSRTVSEVLEKMQTDAPVTGSKLVFDAYGLTALDFQQLRARIGPDIRVIHLTRSYRDIFLSMARGFYHAPARMESLSDRFRDAIAKADITDAKIGPPQAVAPLVCFRQLATLLDNDLQIHSLRSVGVPYLQISYDEVADRLLEIVRFTGSEAPPAAIADVLARPAVAKLPTFAGADVIANLAELEPLFESFEILRRALITKPCPPTSP